MYAGAMERRPAPRRGEQTDRIWSGVILAELRQAAISYTEAALESTSPDVRRVFERLAYDTARKHEQLTAILQQNRLLEPAFAAPAAEVQRAAAQAAETARSAKTLGAGRAGIPATPPQTPPQTPPYQPRTMQGYSPYINMQQQQPRPPEFALPHNMPFGGLPSGAYVPPQPQQRQIGGVGFGSAGSAEREAPPPHRDPEPALSSALREEASAERGEGSSPAAASGSSAASEVAEPVAPPAPKRTGRRAKPSPAVASATAGDETEQSTTM